MKHQTKHPFSQQIREPEIKQIMGAPLLKPGMASMVSMVGFLKGVWFFPFLPSLKSECKLELFVKLFMIYISFPYVLTIYSYVLISYFYTVCYGFFLIWGWGAIEKLTILTTLTIFPMNLW